MINLEILRERYNPEHPIRVGKDDATYSIPSGFLNIVLSDPPKTFGLEDRIDKVHEEYAYPEGQEIDTPYAPVVLREHRGEDFGHAAWHVTRCPYCKKRHRHEIKWEDQPLMTLFGTRRTIWHVERSLGMHDAPCGVDRKYILVAVTQRPSGEDLDTYFPLVKTSRGQASERSAFTAEIKDHVWMETDGHCSYCGVKLRPFSTFSIDHATPVSKGGSNDLWNLVACCRSCNSIKGGRDVEYLRNRLGIQSFWFEREGGNA